MKISFIIPVYNVENYISRCLNSILHQGYGDFEIILVDDGSTDKSGEICDYFAEKENKIKVVHKSNGGISSARNQAIEMAKGEWTWFIDADDYLEDNALAIMTQLVKKEIYDIAMAGYRVVDEYGNQKEQNVSENNKILTSQEGLLEMYTPKDYPYQGYVWNKVFRTSIIKRFNLRFHEDIYFNEDRLFIVQFLCKSLGKVAYTTKSIYNYCQRDGSSMSTIQLGYNPKYATDFKAFVLMYENIKQSSNPSSIIRLARKGIALSFMTNHKMMIDHEQFNKDIHQYMAKELLRTRAWTQYLSMIFKEATRELLYWVYPQLLTHKK